MKQKKILIISRDKNLTEVLRFCFEGWGYHVSINETSFQDITPIKRLSPDVVVVDVYSANQTQLEICRILKDDFITAFIPVITLIDKRQLRSQLLNLKQGVDDYLIKPPDPLDLRVRVEMAMRRSQRSFYATPLTGLPGGRIIEEVLQERIKTRVPFSFGYLDIDHFKYFNDCYGYLKGDRAIMQAAYMLYSAIKACGNHDDFIGHIGGDDFVFITTPDKYKAISTHFIAAFNKIMPFHYKAEERKRGFITARDRTRKVKSVSLMTVSISIVNRLSPVELKSPIEINERVTEVKRYLKTFSGSKFMADRRNNKKNISTDPQIFELNKKSVIHYRPLGQILLERDLISNEKLDEALVLHWRRGVIFGEILLELGFVHEKDLNRALKENQRVS